MMIHIPDSITDHQYVCSNRENILEINFFKDPSETLFTEIHCEEISLYSIQEIDLPLYEFLFTQKDLDLTPNLKKIATKISSFVKEQISFWEEGNPFSTFSIFDNQKDRFLGVISIIPKREGIVIIDYLFDKKITTNDMKSMILSIICIDYLKTINEEGYLIEGSEIKKAIVPVAFPLKNEIITYFTNNKQAIESEIFSEYDGKLWGFLEFFIEKIYETENFLRDI